MSMPIAQAAAPFAEDQLSEIRRLLTGATPEQRLWLGGYVAGFQAATEAPAAPATPPTAKAKLTIFTPRNPATPRRWPVRRASRLRGWASPPGCST